MQERPKLADEPSAVGTRNSYGVRVLNTARLLFLDIDLESTGFFDRIKQRIFGGVSAQEKALSSLKDALRAYGGATLRVYRTASGFRAIAIDREFDPASQAAQELMRATGTDRAYAQLCLAQPLRVRRR